MIIFPNENFLEKYGNNSYALVTGATDGIGKGYCEELAKRGFNLILVSRNADKLEKVKKELKEIRGSKQSKQSKLSKQSIDIKTIVFDFDKENKIEDYERLYNLAHEDSKNSTKNIDISVLINNVGTGIPKSFSQQSIIDTYSLINLNVIPITMLTKLFLDKLNNRNYKSAIINISSIAALTPIPYFTQYSATKVFTNYLSLGLSSSNNYPNIDIMISQPGGVSTNLSKLSSDGVFITDPNSTAASTLDKLGKIIITEGTFFHCVIGFVVWAVDCLCPEFIKLGLVGAVGQVMALVQKNKRKKE